MRNHASHAKHLLAHRKTCHLWVFFLWHMSLSQGHERLENKTEKLRPNRHLTMQNGKTSFFLTSLSKQQKNFSSTIALYSLTMRNGKTSFLQLLYQRDRNFSSTIALSSSIPLTPPPTPLLLPPPPPLSSSTAPSPPF